MNTVPSNTAAEFVPPLQPSPLPRNAVHVVSRNVESGELMERVHDTAGRLIRLIRRIPQAWSERQYDPYTGACLSLTEVATMPDGTVMNRRKIFTGESCEETVSMMAANQKPQRLVKRRQYGSRIIFQGQTDYYENGCPRLTVNHDFDLGSGSLIRREMTHWLTQGLPAMTENYFYTANGRVSKYQKIIHYTSGGPFSEDTQEIDTATSAIRQRTLLAFTAEGKQICLDAVYYDKQGKQKDRNTTFFDALGIPITQTKKQIYPTNPVPRAQAKLYLQ